MSSSDFNLDAFGMTPQDKQIFNIEGPDMDFEIRRQRVQTGLTFSSEAFEQFLANIAAFIGSRAVRFWQETGEPPTIMRVGIRTAIDTGEPSKSFDRVPYQELVENALELAETAIGVHELVKMDSPSDKATHAEVCEGLRHRLNQLAEHRDDLRKRMHDA